MSEHNKSSQVSQNGDDQHLSECNSAKSAQLLEEAQMPTGATAPSARDIDHGHAWMTLAASAGSHATFGFLLHAFSVLYGDIVEHFQASWASVGWVGSLCGASFGLFALCQGFVVDKIGCRYACMLGGLLTSCGLVLSSLLVSVPYLWFTYGFITGVSCGLYMLGSVVIVQRSFRSKLPLANGIRTSCVNIGGLIGGPLMRYLIDEYGLRGALLLEAGILLHSVVCGACYREPSIKQASEDSVIASSVSSPDGIGQSQNCLNDSCKDKLKQTCCSLGCCSREIFKNTRLMLYMAASFLQCAGISIFYHHIVNYALFMGFNKNESALLPFALNIGIGVGALMFGFLANLPGYDGVLQIACVILIKGVVILTTIAVTRFSVLLFLVGLSGFFGGSIFAVEVTNMTKMVSLDLIVPAQAMMMTMFGSSSLISVSFAGFLVDVTGSYAIPVCLSGSLQSLAAAFYMSIVCINRRHTHKADTIVEAPADKVTKL